MKIRIQGNSIRLRLTQTEVKNFGTTGMVEEKIQFGHSPDSALTYALIRSEGRELKASFKKNRIEVKVPQNLATVWTDTELVGLDNNSSPVDNTSLKILIEKDFACLKERVGEDESDMFPHPEQENLKC